MKRSLTSLLISAVLLAACAPAGAAIDTAVAQIQGTTATHTPSPTGTALPSETPTPTLIPTVTALPTVTPDVRVISIHPKDLMLQKNDLPGIGSYSTQPGWVFPIENSAIRFDTTRERDAYLAETGRIYGWNVTYMRGPITNTGVFPKSVYHLVQIFSTVEGAQRSVELYSPEFTGLRLRQKVQSLDAPVIGDASRAFQNSRLNDNGRSDAWIFFLFRYRNITHTIILNGLEGDVSLDFAVDIAEKLMERLKILPFTDSVVFEP